MITDLDGNLVHFNKIAQVFFREDLCVLVGTPFSDYLESNQLPLLLTSKPIYQPLVSHHIRLKDLSDPVTLRVYKNELKGFCVIVAESLQVTEEVLLNREERKWAERLQLMLFGISHELKTPLAVARGYTEAMKDDGNGPLAIRAMEALEQISGILNNMTEAAREFKDDHDTIDLGHGLEMYGKTMNYTEPTKKYIGSVETNFEDALGKYVRVSKPRLYQILTNLFENSIRATQHLETDAQVRINTHICDKPHHSKCIVLEFTDNGCGMDEDTVGKVFTPYFTTRAPDTGTGLGGYFVYQFIMDAGGTLEVESQEGLGTTFMAHLPYTKKGTGS